MSGRIPEMMICRQNDVCLAGRVRHRMSLFKRQGQRLFTENVFSRPGSGKRLLAMQIIRR
ncbi:hypothetical protein D3C72_2317970 [compost metagenome]